MGLNGTGVFPNQGFIWIISSHQTPQRLIERWFRKGWPEAGDYGAFYLFRRILWYHSILWCRIQIRCWHYKSAKCRGNWVGQDDFIMRQKETSWMINRVMHSYHSMLDKWGDHSGLQTLRLSRFPQFSDMKSWLNGAYLMTNSVNQTSEL